MKPDEQVQVSDEDRARLSQLKKEILRLKTEYAQIVGRYLSIEAETVRLDYRPKTETGEVERMKTIGIIVGPGGCGAYEEPPGICYPIPCDDGSDGFWV